MDFKIWTTLPGCTIAVNESSSHFDSVKKQYHGKKCYLFALVKNVAPPPK